MGLQHRTHFRSEPRDARLSGSVELRQTKGFLDLPAELRDRIYKLILGTPTWLYAGKHQRRGPALALANSQVRKEFLDVYYSTHGLTIWVSSDEDFKDNIGSHWLKIFGPQAIPSLRRFMFYIKTKTSSYGYGWHHRRDFLIVLGPLSPRDVADLGASGAVSSRYGGSWSMSFWDVLMPPASAARNGLTKVVETVGAFLDEKLEDGRRRPRLTLEEFETLAGEVGSLSGQVMS